MFVPMAWSDSGAYCAAIMSSKVIPYGSEYDNHSDISPTDDGAGDNDVDEDREGELKYPSV